LLVAIIASLTHNETALIVLTFIASGGLFALRDRGYQWLVMLLTPTALLMISTVDFQGWSVAISRVLDTAIGIAVALIAMAIVAD
jgi:hypothetical protein